MVTESRENTRVPTGTMLVPMAAQRILALATESTESLDMKRNVTGMMKDSLDRTEVYFFFLSTLFPFFHSQIILL